MSVAAKGIDRIGADLAFPQPASPGTSEAAPLAAVEQEMASGGGARGPDQRTWLCHHSS
jgi:hypothetical protein